MCIYSEPAQIFLNFKLRSSQHASSLPCAKLGTEELSVTQTEDGGTLIDGGNGSTVTIDGVTPEQSAGSVTIDGESVPGNGNFDLQASLQSAASASAQDEVVGEALDGATDQGGGSSDGTDGDTDSGSDIDGSEDQEDAGDGDELSDGPG